MTTPFPPPPAPPTDLPDGWHASSVAMGKRALPTMQKLHTRIPGLVGAVLSTPDGFNICSIGLQSAHVGKMAAINSSLFTVGTAAITGMLAAEKDVPLDMVTLASGDTSVIAMKIPNRNVGHMVLMIAAQRNTLGVIMVGARAIAAELQELF